MATDVNRLADRIEAAIVVSVMEQPKSPGPVWAMPLSDEDQAAIVAALRACRQPCPGCDGHECEDGCAYPGAHQQKE